MTTFFEQARTKTALWGESLRHVQRLAASWQALSDLCFSDLLLLAPVVGEDASRSVVLAQVRRDGIEAKGDIWSAEEDEKFRAPIRAQYESQGSPYYATARLWDDGVIDPADTRLVLGLGLSAAANAPIEPTRFGLFRM